RAVRALEPGLVLGLTYPFDRRQVSRHRVLAPAVWAALAAIRQTLPRRIGTLLERAGATVATLHWGVASQAVVERCHARGAGGARRWGRGGATSRRSSAASRATGSTRSSRTTRGCSQLHSARDPGRRLRGALHCAARARGGVRAGRPVARARLRHARAAGRS